MNKWWLSGCLYALLLTGVVDGANAQSAVGARDRSVAPRVPEVSTGAVNRSRQALGNELEESLRRAKDRLNLEAQSYSTYLEQRLKLEKELKESMATELSAFEVRLIESLMRQAQTVLQGKQSVLLEQLQKYSKEQQEVVNADVIAYEASRRHQAMQLISEHEKKIRDEIQAAQLASEERAQSEVRRQVALRGQVLQAGLEKRLLELDRDYAMQGHVDVAKVNRPSTSAKIDAVKPESEALQAIASVSTAEWDVTEADATVRGLLSRWAARAKWTLVWDSDIDLPIGGNAAFKGSFAKAVASAVEALVPERDRLAISLFEKNKVIRVQRRY